MEVVQVNDTVGGGGLMTVSIFNNPNVSLCYKVHGQANRFFNLISDNCVSVNTHYARVNVNSPNIDSCRCCRSQSRFQQQDLCEYQLVCKGVEQLLMVKVVNMYQVNRIIN